MWLSSCASTPSSSTRFIFSSRPGRDGHRRVLRVAARRERVRRRVVDDVQARLRQPARDAQALDEVVEPGVLLRIGRLGVRDRERGLVAVVVRHDRRDDHDHRDDHDADDAAAAATGRTPPRRGTAGARSRRSGARSCACSRRSARTTRTSEVDTQRVGAGGASAMRRDLRSELDLGHLGRTLLGLEVLA